jgi:hypothetical protein
LLLTVLALALPLLGRAQSPDLAQARREGMAHTRWRKPHADHDD